MRKILAVGRKEFHQIARDRRTLMVLLFVPVFMLLLFGYALNFDIRHVRLAVEDNDRSVVSRDVISAFVNSGYFDLVATAANAEQFERLIDFGQVRAVLVIPQGLEQRVLTGRRTPVQVVIDGDNANTATTVMGYALRILQTVSARYQRQPIGGAAAGPLLSVEPRIWYNPELRSALFLVPGLIAYIAMLSAVISTALSVVREKERGTMEQVRMAPVGTVAFVVGKTMPYFGISMLSAILIFLTSMVLFGLPMNGSWALLLLAIALYVVGALGFGLLISTLADTQQVAFQMALLASFLPTFLLSGFVFPISSMPAAIQSVTYVVSARYFLVALRSVALKGVGAAVVWPQLVALGIYAVVMLGLASVRLKRQWT
jgi:ABC-2 type transport system permease protein